jgi:hypothetical protein
MNETLKNVLLEVIENQAIQVELLQELNRNYEEEITKCKERFDTLGVKYNNLEFRHKHLKEVTGVGENEE